MSDPRGPIRKVVEIEETTTATFLTLSCGHRGSHAQHFTYRIGEPCHCFQCGEELRLNASLREA